jgi:transcription initiation factor IIE alpha subunit
MSHVFILKLLDPIPMGRRKTLSEDLRWVLVRMHHKRGASVNDIERDTGVNKRTIQRILELFQTTGEVTAKKARAKRGGKLNDDNMNVSHNIHLIQIYFLNISYPVRGRCP